MLPSKAIVLSVQFFKFLFSHESCRKNSTFFRSVKCAKKEYLKYIYWHEENRNRFLSMVSLAEDKKKQQGFERNTIYLSIKCII